MTSRPDRRSPSATASGLGRRLGAPTATSTAAPARHPVVTARRSSASPDVPAMIIVTRRNRSARFGRPPPGTSQPGLADDGRRSDGGEVARRREPGRDQPGVVVQRLADGTGHADGPVDEDEGAGACSGRHQEDDRAAPSPLDDEARGDDQRAKDGGDLGDSDGELTDGLWDQPGGFAEIVAQTGVRALRHLDEQDQGDRRDAPGHDADDVARVAVVPLAGRSFVEARLLGGGGVDHGRCARRAHVVPSRATAATTRNTSTTPSRSPP